MAKPGRFGFLVTPGHERRDIIWERRWSQALFLFQRHRYSLKRKVRRERCGHDHLACVVGLCSRVGSILRGNGEGMSALVSEEYVFSTQWDRLILGVLRNSTIYIYGGRSVSADDQISPPPKASCIDLGPLWNSLIVDNWFHALDLSRSFNVISPHLTGLSLPSFQDGGPPTSGVGALWPSSDGKYVYLFRADLGDSSWHSRLMWRYNISSDSWSMIATSGVKQVPPIEGASCWIPQYGTNNSGVGVYLGGIIPETSIAMSTVDEGYVASALLFDMAFIQANSAFLMSGTS